MTTDLFFIILSIVEGVIIICLLGLNEMQRSRSASREIKTGNFYVEKAEASEEAPAVSPTYPISLLSISDANNDWNKEAMAQARSHKVVALAKGREG